MFRNTPMRLIVASVCLGWSITVAKSTKSTKASPPFKETLKAIPSQLKSIPSQLKQTSTTIHSRFRAGQHPIDLRNVFSTRQLLPATDRFANVPAYIVGTSWGSPYLLFDKDGQVYSPDELKLALALSRDNVDEEYVLEKRQVRKKMARKSQALYFLNYEDAMAHMCEMKQMGPSMSRADIRITTVSLAKAFRQSLFLGDGMPNGQPINKKGEFTNAWQKYRLVPSARELHFAKQCCPRTRERVGFFEEHHKDQNMLRWTIRKKGFTIPKNMSKPRMVELDADGPYEHLRDKKGIPVFYADGLVKQRGWHSKSEIPMFMSYEDCVDAWKNMREHSEDGMSTPEKPPIEVFNFLDVVAGMDRDRRFLQRRHTLKTKALNVAPPKPTSDNKFVSAVQEAARFVQKKQTTISQTDLHDALYRSKLQSIFFVPSSRNAEYKRYIRALGNNKARLRRMK